MIEFKSTDYRRPGAYQLPPKPRSYVNDNDKLQGAYDLIAKIKAERELKKTTQVRFVWLRLDSLQGNISRLSFSKEFFL